MKKEWNEKLKNLYTEFDDAVPYGVIEPFIDNLLNQKIVVYRDGSYKVIEDGITWEYENDSDWLFTINPIN